MDIKTQRSFDSEVLAIADALLALVRGITGPVIPRHEKRQLVAISSTRAVLGFEHLKDN